MQRSDARKSLAVFFGLLVPLTTLARVLVVKNGMTLPLVAYAMWTPAIASVLTRLIRREGFQDVSFRFRTPGMKWSVLVACLYPFVLCSLAYGGAWMTGLADFSWTLPQSVRPVLSHLPMPVSFLIWVMLVSIIHLPMSLALAFGEELGWRGFMLTRLIEADIPFPVALSGIIWGLHHVPVILSGQYTPSGATGPAAIIPFMIGITAAGFAFAAVRLKSGSVWPAVLFHGVFNIVTQDGFGVALQHTSKWLGEAGYLETAVEVMLAAGVWLWFRKTIETYPPGH